MESVHSRLRCSQSSIYRILQTLAHRGYVVKTSQGLYRLLPSNKRRRFGCVGYSAQDVLHEKMMRSVRAAAMLSGIQIVRPPGDDAGCGEGAIQYSGFDVDMDLVVLFGNQERPLPPLSNELRRGGVPTISLEVPQPGAVYLGVDHFRVGIDAGQMLAEYALERWKGGVDWVIGMEMTGLEPYCHSRMLGTFEGVRALLPSVPQDRYRRLYSRSAAESSANLLLDFLQRTRPSEHILIAAATNQNVLAVFEALAALRREISVLVVGIECIPEQLVDLHGGESLLIGAVVQDPDRYGQALVELGIAMIQGKPVPPYNFVKHRAWAQAKISVNSVRG
jgi:ribose transport system substrate-binding protein